MAFTCCLLTEAGLQCWRSFSQRGRDEKSKRSGSVVEGRGGVMEYGECGHRRRGGLRGQRRKQRDMEKSVGDRRDRENGVGVG